MASYGSLPEAAVPRNRRSALPYVLAGGAAVILSAVGIADLASKGASATALAWVPVRRGAVLAPGQMLYDAALEPLYTQGEEVIAPYKWIGANSKEYDPIKNNPFRDLPTKRGEIKDPDEEFRGMAPKSLMYSCAKKGDCEPQENVLDYLPEEEDKTLANRDPLKEQENVWSDMPLDY